VKEKPHCTTGRSWHCSAVGIDDSDLKWLVRTERFEDTVAAYDSLAPEYGRSGTPRALAPHQKSDPSPNSFGVLRLFLVRPIRKVGFYWFRH